MSDDMHDDPFNKLKAATAPDPRAEAKKRALAAGMAAFEAAQIEAEKNLQPHPKEISGASVSRP